MLTVRNKRNGATTPMTQEQWDKINSNPQWSGVFSVVEAQVPPEVQALTKQKAKRVEASQQKDA